MSTILAIILLGVVIGVTSGGGEKPNNTQNNQGVATQPAEESMKITAAQLADDFDANQVSAEAKWKDKLVEFSSEVSNITEQGISFQKVSSKEFSLTQISCKIANKDDLLVVTNGQQVTVRGKVGGQTFGVIDLNNCSLVR